MTDALESMFSGVGLITETKGAKVRGIEVPDNLLVAHVGPPIADPVEWLNRSRIPLVHEILGPSVRGCFTGGQTLDKCMIQLNALFSGPEKNPRALHTLWHEIGHAIDHIHEQNELLIINQHFYSTKYDTILKEHAGLIVSLREAKDDASFHGDADWSEYAHQPNELWAEAVALAMTRPAALWPTKLWDVMAEELKGRNINVAAKPEVTV